MPSLNKTGKNTKMPTLALEFSCVSLNLLFIKLYSEQLFATMSFFAIFVPIMAYLIVTMFGYLLKFIQLM
jgi:hypothetical protein